MQNKLAYETISQSFGSSFSIRHFDESAKNVKPVWHFHPELELVYIKGGTGRRHIGKHQSHFRHGDLALLGANLPHYGFTEPQSQNEAEIVIQFNDDFLGEEFLQKPETRKIRELFDRADYGIVFSARIRKTMGPRIEALSTVPPFSRLLSFIKILQELAGTDEYRLLNEEKCPAPASEENEKLNQVFGIIRKEFQHGIRLESVAAQADMTVPAFCRYFKKQSGKTFTQFVNEFRIVHACKLLSDTSKMITEIAEESGYRNFSYFNRQFHKFTGKTPSQYRLEFRYLVN
jgi:AraC-like DNA-binding protein/quercetin dioxygenase-like cupin family protein